MTVEEERDFLLRSLDDLDREREAGDIDDGDYVALRDDYTARAAAAIRALEADERERDAPDRGRRGRVVTAVVVVVIAVLAGVLVAQASGRRDPGELGTGAIRDTIRGRLAQARDELESGDTAAAVDAYDDVLADDPANPEALTYRGWALFLGGDPADGVVALIDAATAAPTYPDVHAFLAVAFERLGRPASALAELDRMAALDPAPELLELTAPLRARLEEAVATTATSAPTAPTTAPTGPR
jgi:tetratricopeptide (TPR) repeat protein